MKSLATIALAALMGIALINKAKELGVDETLDMLIHESEIVLDYCIENPARPICN